MLIFRDGRWLFSHDQLREGLIRLIDPKQRPELHRQAALAIEAVYPDQYRYAHQLLEHWHKAGDLDKEIEVLQVVIKRTFNAFSDYERMRQLIDRTLSKLHADHPRRPTLINAYAAYYERQERNEEALVMSKQAYALACQHNNKEEMAISLANMGMAHSQAKRYQEAEECLLRALDMAQPDSATERRILVSLGVNAKRLGDQQRAMAYLERATAIESDLDDLSRGILLNHKANLLLQSNQLEEAQSYLEEAATIFKDNEAMTLLSMTQSNLGDCLYAREKYAEALNVYRESLALKQRLSSELWSLAHTMLRIGACLLPLEDYEAAEATLCEALNAAQASGYRHYVAETLLCFAALYQATDRPEEAQNLLCSVGTAPEVRDLEVRARQEGLGLAYPGPCEGALTLEQAVEFVLHSQHSLSNA